MNIISALKKTGGYLRVTFENRWLLWDGNYWVVYQRKYRARNSQTLCQTKDQDFAVKILLGGEQ